MLYWTEKVKILNKHPDISLTASEQDFISRMMRLINEHGERIRMGQHTISKINKLWDYYIIK